MPEEPGVGWMALFLPDRTTETASSIRPEDAQVYFDPGDRLGVLAGPARRTTGLIEKLDPKRARVRCGDAEGHGD